MKINLKIILLISVLLFSGCAGIPNGLKNFVAEHSDIAKDEDYSKYRQMAADGQLTEDGYFREGTESISKFEKSRLSGGKILVTFADNANINACYYLDEAKTEKAEDIALSLDPGDAIYAEINSEKEEHRYHFKEFEIWEFDEENQRKALLGKTETQSGLLYRIPEDFKGSGIQIVSVGYYDPIQLGLKAIEKVDGTEMEASNAFWIINDEEKPNGTYEIDSFRNTELTFDYSDIADEFYPSEALPENAYNQVVFGEIPMDETVMNYSVILHPYKTILFNTDGLKSVKDTFVTKIVKSGTTDVLYEGKKEDKEVHLDYKFKGGDTIDIFIGTSFQLYNNQDLGISSEPSLTDEGYRYTVTIPESDRKRYEIILTLGGDEKETIIWDGWDVSNGRLRLYLQKDKDIEIKPGYPLPNEIVYVSLTPDKGYYVKGSKTINESLEETIKTADLKEFVSAHPVMKAIHILLKDSDEFGSCEYKLGKDLFTEGEGSFAEGEALSYSCSLKADSPYYYHELFDKKDFSGKIRITESMDGKTLSCHQLGIEKIIDKSLDANSSSKGVTVILNNSSNSLKDLFGKKNDEIASISHGEIFVRLSQKDKSVSFPELKPGDIVTLTVFGEFKIRVEGFQLTPTGSKSGTYEYQIKIPKKAPEEIEFYLYPRNSVSDGTFTEPVPEHAKVLIYDQKVIEYRKGDELPGNKEEIHVKVIPEKGYYVLSEKDASETWEGTCLWEDLEREISIDHIIAKKILLKLNRSASKGKCTFKLDGEEVNGRIEVMKGQTLTADFVLNPNSKYEIVNPDTLGGVLKNVKKSDKITVRIPITEDMENSSINCGDYIQLKEKK